MPGELTLKLHDATEMLESFAVSSRSLSLSMEHLWSPAGATGGNRSQWDRPENGSNGEECHEEGPPE